MHVVSAFLLFLVTSDSFSIFPSHISVTLMLLTNPSQLYMKYPYIEIFSWFLIFSFLDSKWSTLVGGLQRWQEYYTTSLTLSVQGCSCYSVNTWWFWNYHMCRTVHSIHTQYDSQQTRKHVLLATRISLRKKEGSDMDWDKMREILWHWNWFVATITSVSFY